MPARKKTSKRRTAKRRAKKKHLIVWMRLPEGVSVTAHGPRSKELARLLRNAGLDPQARCFGGDSCIV